MPTTERLHAWAADLGAVPFRARGRMRDGLDCFGLILLCYHDLFGVELESYTDRYASTDRPAWAGLGALIAAERDRDWRPILGGAERPADAVLLRMHNLPVHVGLVLGRGDFLHTTEDLGICKESYRAMNWRHRVLGFYRHPLVEAAAWA
jgi:cell wall-associated NlpC family hydrolase